MTTLFSGSSALVASSPLDVFFRTIGQAAGLEEFMYAQLAPTLTHLPPALLTYPFKPNTSAEVEAAEQKTNGFIRGVCHGNTNYEQMKGAGIEWNRCDIPFPFDSAGNQREDYV
jgi:hypothetical protein